MKGKANSWGIKVAGTSRSRLLRLLTRSTIINSLKIGASARFRGQIARVLIAMKRSEDPRMR